MPAKVDVEYDAVGRLRAAGETRYRAVCRAAGCGWFASCSSSDDAAVRAEEHAASCVYGTVPAGFELRTARRLDPSTRRQRPTSTWRGDLCAMLDAGALDRWVTPAECSPGNAAASLLDRGALLIAEKNSTKRYRLTPYGAAVARGEKD